MKWQNTKEKPPEDYSKSYHYVRFADSGKSRFGKLFKTSEGMIVDNNGNNVLEYLDESPLPDEQGDAIPADLEQRAKEYAKGIVGDYDPELQEEFDNIVRHYLAGVESITVDYAEVEDDHKRLVRELDEIINGKEGMAKQASLCDIVAQLKKEGLSPGLTKEQIAQICEMADNDYAGQEAIMFAEWIRESAWEWSIYQKKWFRNGVKDYYTDKDLYGLFKLNQGEAK